MRAREVGYWTYTFSARWGVCESDQVTNSLSSVTRFINLLPSCVSNPNARRKCKSSSQLHAPVSSRWKGRRCPDKVQGREQMSYRYRLIELRKHMCDYIQASAKCTPDVTSKSIRINCIFWLLTPKCQHYVTERVNHDAKGRGLGTRSGAHRAQR